MSPSYWSNEISGRTQHRAEHRGYALRLPSVTNEREARALAHHFNLQMETESANEYSTILERYGVEMLAQVWKPFEPVQRVIFYDPLQREKASEL